jgi:TonB-dependent receptor
MTGFFLLSHHINTYVKRYLLIFLILSINLQGLAQNVIRGIVVDADTGEGLIGATVQIKGTTKGKITDLEGQFIIGRIEESALVLETSFIGYNTQETSIALTQKVTQITISLQPDTQALEAVVVEGLAEGQIAAIVNMKKAANIKNVVSAEQIVTFPDLNAAEVMQRIPGITLQRDQGDGRYVQLRGTPPELTNFNVNGEQIPSPEGDFRYVGLDIIPSDQIEFIEVSKVITPDMDADAIGGSVNVITKGPKEGDPQIRTVFSSGYNNLRQTPNYNLQFSFGQRYKKLGFQINGSYFQNNQGSDNIEYDFTKGPFFNSEAQGLGVNNYFLHFTDVQLRHYDIQRTRVAVSPSLDYKFNDLSRIYVKGMYNSFKDIETRRRKTYGTDDPFNFERYLFGGIEHDLRFRTQNQELATLAIGGEHAIGKINVDYQLFASVGSENVPDYFEVSFENPGQAIDIGFDFSDPDYPRATLDADAQLQATDYENYDFDGLNQETLDVREVLITPRFNIEIPYILTNGTDGFVKFGGKLRSRTKERDVLNRTYSNYRPINNGNTAGEGEPLILPDVAGSWREDNLLNQGYVLEVIPDLERMLDHFEFNSAYYVQSRNASRIDTYVQDYEYEEDIYATYGMVKHQLNDLMILAGLRYELTDITKNRGFRAVTDGGRWVRLDTINSTSQQDFFLPQLQLKYALNEWINVRAAVTRTYSRPNYRDIINAISYDQDDDAEVGIGNPDLKFATATNFDLMIERYQKSSIFSVGLFRKQIDDFVYQFQGLLRDQLLFDPDNPNDVIPTSEVTFAFNGRQATVTGAELQAQFKFDFLPGALSNFGLYTNYTYTDSKASIASLPAANLVDAPLVPLTSEGISTYINGLEVNDFTLPGQSTHTANVALFYDGPKFFARASANFQDDFLVAVGLDRDFDEYYDDAFRLDYTMNYKLNPNVTVFGDFINITNTPLRFYLGNESVVKQQEFYSWWFRFGARINL